ncbi:DUF262 domain-containing protein [Selenomonas montiformis]|uniref:DUF262 domain-containing protein n=1 Tax=Selenomonas montiformis TaxID=2652285 RepID=UPI003F89A774
MEKVENVEKEIYEKRRNVRYDLREMIIENIVQKYDESICDDDEKNGYNMIYIPEYQRDFTWDEDRQSKFIESIILGLPIPFIFVAENRDSSWELVDGSQRIRTINAFVGDELKLRNLPAIKSLNGYKFSNLSKSRQGKFLNTALKIIVLSEETSDDVKIDMFERINRGSDLLKPMEKRKGIYVGPFNDFIYDYCKNNKLYNELVKNDKWLERRQEKEELLLRFFALSEKSDFNLKEGITNYLDKFLDKKNKEWQKLGESDLKRKRQEYENKINEVNKVVDRVFPYGYRHRSNPQTKRSVFEAISVGTYLAICSGKKIMNLEKKYIEKELNSTKFKKFTHVANELHKRKKLEGRIMFIRNMLIEK